MASADSPYAKVVKVCSPCHSRKVSCDLVRPTCGACVKYSKHRPDHVCTYGPDAAQPGESKVRRTPEALLWEDKGGKGKGASLLPSRTRAEARALAALGVDDEDGRKVEKADKVEGQGAFSYGVHSPRYRRMTVLRPVEPPVLPVIKRRQVCHSRPTTFAPFPLALPSLPRTITPPPSPVTPVTPVTPYFTSVFAPTPSPELCSPPVLSPRPSSGLRRPSFPDHATLFDPAFLAAQRSFARLSVSPPSTSGGSGLISTAAPLDLSDDFGAIFSFNA
ncbi:hypothetical protein JCM11641_006233 [Rhodosporidiobolus odoratus]